jgi:hypothetical protein
MNLRSSRRLFLVAVAVGLVAGCDSGTATKIVPAAPLSDAEREAWKKQIIGAYEVEKKQRADEEHQQGGVGPGQQPARPGGVNASSR